MPKDDDLAKDIATHLLHEEVLCLQDQAVTLMEPGNETLLEGKLQLVKELARVLHKHTLGGSGTGLIELLLKRSVGG